MKRISVVRRRLAYAARIFSLAACAAAGALNAHAACQLTQLAEIPVTMDAGQTFVDGEINGQVVRMVADTGASHSAIYRQTTTALGLRPLPLENVDFYGAGGKAAADFVRVDKIKIGSINWGSMTMFVIGQQGAADTDGPGAIIGTDFLGQADIEFDLAHGMIRLMRSKDCSEGQVVYWKSPYSVEKMKPFKADVMIDYRVDVTINGKRMEALLDSGAQVSVLTYEGARKAGIPLPEKDGSGGSFNGIGKQDVANGVVKLDSFAFDQEMIKNPKINVADLFKASKDVQVGSRIARKVVEFPDMLLGADFFMAHRIYIAKDEGKIYITYSGGPIFKMGPTPAATAPSGTPLSPVKDRY